MSSTTASTIKSRDVVDYALEQNCFYDHQNTPYKFHHLVEQLQASAEPAKPDGLVDQPGLTTTTLPRTKIKLEPVIDHEAYPIPTDPVVSSALVFPFLCKTQNLRLPSETIDIGYDLDKENVQYLHDMQLASSCNILTQWLPLTYVGTEIDEGLEFPSTVSRWQTLALRELEGDENAPPEYGLGLTHDQDIQKNVCAPEQIREIFSLNDHRQEYLEPVSAPLSPASDLDGPFVPSAQQMVIDLTSEPSSPINHTFEKLQWSIQHGYVDSEPAASSAMPSSPPTAKVAFLSTASNKPSDLKLDIPMIPPSSETSLISDGLSAAQGHKLLDSNEARQSPVEQGSFFDEALQVILDGKHHQANQQIEEERLNPAGTLLRLPTPGVDFHIPRCEWKSHLSSTQEHFKWLQKTLPDTFNLLRLEDLSRLDTSLKWRPIPQGSGRVSTAETAIQLSPISRELLSMRLPQLCSRNYVVAQSEPMAFQVVADDEIEIEVVCTEMVSSLARDQSCNILTTPNPHKSLSTPSLKDLLGTRRQELRHKLDGKEDGLLLRVADSNAISSLLSSLIQLRQPKKLKTASNSSQPSMPSATQSQMSDVDSLSTTHKDIQNGLKEAPTPRFDLPAKTCRYIVSMNLSRSILSHLEKVWQQAELIDRDFSQHNTVVWSPGSAQRKEVISSLSFEADISLGPGAGLILTTILKVKQKPLPGSTILTPFRERVKLVSEKYESMFILVSESNPLGEFVGSPTTSDITGYADFVRFTTSLQAGISVYLVSGSDQTLSKWAVYIMSRFSASANQFGHFLDFRDGAWELFLRRAGFNISAAQAIVGLLVSEYGNLGLTKFLSMSAEERVSKYGQLMGGRRILNNVSRILDRAWV